MKKALTVLAAAALLLMGLSSAWAASIQFTESLNPLDETTPATITQTNAPVTIVGTPTAENATATFIFTFATSVAPGLYGGALTNPNEPETFTGATPKASDVGFVDIATKKVWFFSDGWTGSINLPTGGAGTTVTNFQQVVDAYNSLTGSFKFPTGLESDTEAIEIMDFNGATTTVGLDHIDFLIFSPASEVPLPPTALLLGSGLLGLVGFRFRKHLT
jgi:hypothetical protein